MSKTLKALLCLVMISALAMMTVFFLRYRTERGALSALTAQLEESCASWEGTAAEKEAVNSDLREAQLSLEEANEQAEKLTAQIETLKQEIAALENPLTLP